MIDLADGRRVAMRPRAREPKIKFYMFARRSPEAGKAFTSEQLAAIKRDVGAALEQLWRWIQQDVNIRLAK